MKKFPCAFALLGLCAGTAAAQSSISLYGRASVYVAAESGGDRSAVGDDTVFRLRDGGEASGKSGSRWGLRGTEDLGGGLSASFVLESGFNLDSGTSRQGGRLFGRNAYVGLQSSQLGEVRLGRQETFSRLAMAHVEPTGNAELKLNAAVSISGAGNPGTGEVRLFDDFNGGRLDNMATYYAPKWGGVQLAVALGAGEGSTAARYQAVSATYAAGRVGAVVAYEAYDGFGATYNKNLTLGGNYDFGVVKLFAGLQRTADAGLQTEVFAPTARFGDRTAYTAGATVPLGKAELKLSYAVAEFERGAGNFVGAFAGAREVDLKKFGASLAYNLSKRTAIYSAVNLQSGDLGDYAGVQRDITLFGLTHRF